MLIYEYKEKSSGMMWGISGEEVRSMDRLEGNLQIGAETQWDEDAVLRGSGNTVLECGSGPIAASLIVGLDGTPTGCATFAYGEQCSPRAVALNNNNWV